MKLKFLFSGVIISLFMYYTGFTQPVTEHGALHLKGNQLVDKDNQPVVLRGMSLGWHNMWPRFYNAEVVRWLKNDWGCTVVRAAMGVDIDTCCYVKSPEWSKYRVIEVVDAAIKEGIYVIIDFHSHNIHTAEAKVFFTEMAEKYGKYPNVIYEIFNEPNYQSWDEVKAYSNEVITTIRKIDPDNIIIAGSPHWDQDIHLVADSPLTGYSNLMYSVHFYAATHKQFLRDRCEYALKKGIPIFLSELGGMDASGDGKIDYPEWDTWINWAEKNNISWITWSVSDKKEKCSVLLPSANSLGNWQEKDLNETGVYARKLLRAHAGLK